MKAGILVPIRPVLRFITGCSMHYFVVGHWMFITLQSVINIIHLRSICEKVNSYIAIDQNQAMPSVKLKFDESLDFDLRSNIHSV